ncbi:cell division protein ZapA [Candidatus Aerophobetes bacterium]|uniref:Cell division protein ZapA n=1 Tax=Aerophobetes bacterium TaxID=2030807 RepID=A0A523W675_UNCAE|nr:MAG: cell division protein ZapA [Candidatus Aerophobetes bacterium]
MSPPMRAKFVIFDREYHLKAKEGEEYLKIVASYVDGKIKKIASSTNEKGRERISILACLNIADELHKIKEKNRRAREKIQQLMERIEKETQ